MKFFYKSRFYQRIVQWRVKQQQVARSRDEYDFLPAPGRAVLPGVSPYFYY